MKAISELPARLRIGRWCGNRDLTFRGKETLLRMLWNPESNVSQPFEVDFFGLRYPGNLNNLLDWRVFFFGSYETPILRLLEKISRYLKNGGHRVTYLDVGTNVGQHLLFMSNFADEAYGFEPFPDVLELAQEKLEINKVTNTRLFQVALSNRNTVATFFPPAASQPNKGIGSLVAERSPHLTKEGIQVELRVGSELLAREGIQGVSIVKIDVEGHELQTCEGLKEMFLRDRPFIVLEVSPKSFQTEDQLRSMLYPGAIICQPVQDRLVRYRFGEETCNEQAILVAPREHLAFVNEFVVGDQPSLPKMSILTRLFSPSKALKRG